MNRRVVIALLLTVIAGVMATGAESDAAGVLAPKPLYRDPTYDGAADPSIIFDRAEQTWLMFYTNRRANVPGLTSVTWVHGTPIGIAASKNGAHWTYRGTVAFPPDIPNTAGTPTFWAPALVWADGTYHMFVVVVPGIFTDWQHPRTIIHVTSPDLKTWHYEGTLTLATDKVIDPCVFRLRDGTWRMWYNNERVGKKTYYADSPDLYHWTDKGSANLPRDRGEAPLVFQWRGRYWLLIDLLGNNGLGAYRSDDALHWERQPESLLAKPGTGTDDNNGGHHPEVIVSGDRAYLFYFVHPPQTDAAPPTTGAVGAPAKRSSIQAVELHDAGGWLTCDRNAPTYVDLSAAAAGAGLVESH